MNANINKLVVPEDRELNVLIDLNKIPEYIGEVTNEYLKKRLDIKSMRSLLSWIEKKRTDPEPDSICITGPMSPMAAFQLGAYLGRNFDGDLYYQSENGRRNLVILEKVST